jgi:hypothetical protein
MDDRAEMGRTSKELDIAFFLSVREGKRLQFTLKGKAQKEMTAIPSTLVMPFSEN